MRNHADKVLCHAFPRCGPHYCCYQPSNMVAVASNRVSRTRGHVHACSSTLPHQPPLRHCCCLPTTPGLQHSHSRSYPYQPAFRSSSKCHRRASRMQCWASSDGRLADPVYMQEYQALKDNLISTTRKAGGGLAAYLLFTVDGTAALCALAGSAASNLYLLWMFRDADSINANTRVALTEADKVQGKIPRTIARVFAAYSHALQPRLLVPIALAAASATFNQLVPETPLDTLHQGCLLLGFLAYKVPLILKLADDNLPKAYNAEEMSQPLIDKFDDELDQWGRPKKQLVPLPTEALPENIENKLPVLDLGNLDENVSVTDMAKRMIGWEKDKQGQQPGGSMVAPGQQQQQR